MSGTAMNVYLNDHLSGAMLGSALAEQIRSRHQGTPLGALMGSLAPQIEEDRQALIALMSRIGARRNPVKQTGAWLSEKASQVKFWGPTSGAPELGTYTAVETLTLGVLGKLSLWRALAEVADQYPAIATMDLDDLIGRAHSQYQQLERERLSAARRAFG